VDVKEQYVLCIFLVGNGIADLNGFFAAARNEEAYVFAAFTGGIPPRIPVGRYRHTRLARCRQSVKAERHMVGVAAVRTCIVRRTDIRTEIPEIDKVSVDYAMV